ncbi:MAG: hypothetical protein HC798_04610, partial [Polaribacter sp.]|nr:hypothetical protein [Polaribacter sp.]
MASANGGGTFTFLESMQSHQTNSSAKNAATITSIKITLSSNTSSASTDIKFLPNATSGLDVGLDAGAIFEDNTPLQLYSQLVENTSGQNFALQCLQDGNFDYVIPLTFAAKINDIISITAIKEAMPENVQLYLEDKTTHNFINLSEKNYQFTNSIDGKQTGKLYLHISQKALSNLDHHLESTI